MVVQGLLNEAKDLSEGSTQSARVSAWAHLGKHLGMWNDKIDVNITQPIVITGEDALED